MSNHLALATVTGVLGARVSAHLTAANLTSTVVVTHPTDVDSHATYLHLYSVLPNPGLRNQTVPERTGDGTATVAPRLALDLYYQLTFVGSAANHDTERMAGAVMSGLHAFPRLAPQEITDFLAAQPPGSPLLDSDLADQPEHIRVSPLSSDIEELSRLWGMSQRSFHRLTVLYLVSPVLLDADVPTIRPLPVTTPVVTTYQLRSPRITSLRSSARDLPVVELGDELVVAGHALRADHTRLAVGAHQLDPTSATDTELRLLVDAASGVPAGIHPVQVRHRLELASGEVRDSARSNAVPIALVPRLVPASLGVDAVGGSDPGHDVRLAAQPMPTTDQAAELILTGTGGGARLTSTERRAGGPGVIFRFPPVPTGTYLVRLVVDGAESLLTTDASGAFTGPTVTIP